MCLMNRKKPTKMSGGEENKGVKRSHSLISPIVTESCSESSGSLTIGAIRALLEEKIGPVMERLDSLDLSINQRITNLDSDFNSLREEVIGVKESNEGVWQVARENEARIMTLEKDLREVRQELSNTKSQLFNVNEQSLRLECQSRRDNLRFFGIPEVKGETWSDCVEKIKNLMEVNLGLENTDQISIVRAHRVGPLLGSRSRPILVKFLLWNDRMRVWNAKTQLRGSDLYIDEDYPIEIVKRRKKLLPVFNAARAYNRTVPDEQKLKFSLTVDHLKINNTVYTVNNLHTLPGFLQPEVAATREIDSCICFWSCASPFSNHHPSDFIIDGTKYNCAEQYLMQHKALLFNDLESATAIMKELDPVKQKGLGQRGRGFQRQLWVENASVIAKKGLLAKFSQNGSLRAKLAATGDKKMFEASPKDQFWGIGVGLYDRRITDSSNWRGRNLLGQLLQEVRSEIS